MAWTAALALTSLAAWGVATGSPDGRFALASNALAQSEKPAPARIVVAGGVITEILYALGAQDRIAGVDTTSLYPGAALKEKPNVGYMRALSAEGVLSLKPSLLLAVAGAGPADAVKLVTDAGVPMITLPEDLTADGVVDRIRRVASIAGVAARGDALAAEVAEKFRALDIRRARIAAPKRVLFALSLQNGKVIAGGRNSTADAILRLAGAVNAADGLDGYKPMNDEAIIAAAPDLVLVMNRGEHATTPDQVFAMPAFAATPAARARALLSMDGLYLLGFGPRTPDAARDLMQALYGPADAKP